MGRKCRKCGQRTGPNRRLCKDCAVAKRFEGRPESTTPLETKDGEAVGSWINTDGTWHASVAFDGYEHTFACGTLFDAFPADGVTQYHSALEPDAVCPDCRAALDQDAVPESWGRAILADGGDTMSSQHQQTTDRDDVQPIISEARENTLEAVRELAAEGETDGANGGVAPATIAKHRDIDRATASEHCRELADLGKLRPVRGLGPNGPRRSFLPDGEDEPEIVADGGVTWSDLSGFQRDLLEAVARLERDSKLPYGLAIREHLEARDYENVNHGRLYPNLNQLNEYGLLEKSEHDRRTNTYPLTDEGEALLMQRVERLADACEMAVPVADGGEER